MASAEHGRLEEARNNEVPWRKWGPYLSAKLIGLFGSLDAKKLLEDGKDVAFDPDTVAVRRA